MERAIVRETRRSVQYGATEARRRESADHKRIHLSLFIVPVRSGGGKGQLQFTLHYPSLKGRTQQSFKESCVFLLERCVSDMGVQSFLRISMGTIVKIKKQMEKHQQFISVS